MIRVNIESKKHGKVWRDFETEADALLWVHQCQQTEHWGINERIIPRAQATYEQLLLNPRILLEEEDEQGNIIEPERVVLPAEWSYSLEPVDVTDVEAEANALKEIDWSKVTTIAALKEILKQVIEKV
jgi:hypothetical protein